VGSEGEAFELLGFVIRDEGAVADVVGVVVVGGKKTFKTF
jgi:hypothetical protein